MSRISALHSAASMVNRRNAIAEHAPRLAGSERAALIVLAAGTLVIPTVLGAGADPFRLPKELAFRAEAVVLLALALFYLTGRHRTWTVRLRPGFIVAAAIVCWTLVTAAASTNRQLSVDSLITVVAAAVIFVATCLAAQTTSLVAVDVLMVACCANAVLGLLQAMKIWNPFPAMTYTNVALLGNPNDVGTFLVTPAVVALVLAVVTSSVKRRMIYAGIAVLLVAGLLASGTRTAVIAFVAAVLIFALGQGRHAALAVAAVLAIVFLGLSRPSTTIGRGARDLVEAARSRDYERLFSERLLPFLAALDMTRDHPLLGTGPGCFKYQYMTYRVALRDRYPKEWTRGWPMNWGEVHNDHLQVAAETGLPGYALFLAAIGVAAGIVGRARRRTDAATPEAAFARALRWPLATVVFVVCLAQFPLELAAPRLMLLTLGALCITWDRDDAKA